MSNNRPISKVEAETLCFIKGFIEKNGYSPTIAELATAAGINGNAVAERVTRLLLKGAITKTPRIARSIRLALTLHYGRIRLRKRRCVRLTRRTIITLNS